MIAIDRRAPESLQQQIRRQLAIGIVNRQYPLHAPLPSIRVLSLELGVSVTTVALAYDALKQDGFVEGRTRSGFFVNPDVLTDPGHALKRTVPPEIGTARMRLDYAAMFRNRSFNLPRVVKPADCLVRYRYPLVCGLIDPSLFPIRSWRECVRDSVNVVELANWAADYSAIDDELLIEQLIQRVLARRGIVAHPDAVLVTVGGQQAPYIAMKLLLATGETIGLEDPGYPDGINIAAIEGFEVERLPIDRQGLGLPDHPRRSRALFVQPRHQFPTHAPINQRSVALFLQRGYFDRFVARITSVYRKRCAVMYESLEHHFPGAAQEPEFGGGSIWVRLPEEADAGVLRALVEEEGVFFETGGFTFADERNNRNHIRLGYSAIAESLVPGGITRIANALPRALLRRTPENDGKPGISEAAGSRK